MAFFSGGTPRLMQQAHGRQHLSRTNHQIVAGVSRTRCARGGACKPSRVMNKKRPLVAGLAASVLLLALSSCQGVVAPHNPNGTLQNSVNHIIFLMQENRSFDAYFGKLDDFRASRGLARNVDDLETIFTNPTDAGTLVSNFHLTTSCIFN